MADPLVELLHSDPTEGLRRLLTELAPLVKGGLLREFHRRAEEAIDEAVSHAALTIARKIEAYDDRRGTLLTWFYTITRNAALTVLRREALWSRRSQVLEPVPDDTSGVPPTDPPAPLVEDLWLCIEALSPRQRLVLTADLQAGGVADARDLAAELGSTPNAVYVARSKGRAALRDLLRQRGYEL